MSTQKETPNALIFADDRPTSCDDDLYQWAVDAEDLIRAQHELIETLKSHLRYIEAQEHIGHIKDTASAALAAAEAHK